MSIKQHITVKLQEEAQYHKEKYLPSSTGRSLPYIQNTFVTTLSNGTEIYIVASYYPPRLSMEQKQSTEVFSRLIL